MLDEPAVPVPPTPLLLIPDADELRCSLRRCCFLSAALKALSSRGLALLGDAGDVVDSKISPIKSIHPDHCIFILFWILLILIGSVWIFLVFFRLKSWKTFLNGRVCAAPAADG
jgi:hypothetical protein